ncbi:restriction endonuclease subunit S [Lacihabitans sp. CCS-44]|uniref:restriction endonuclease subunit S n=1 Tax=Lacihabitans sp. CCS-44 TaxID=2487331 RepID=UPI0020CBA331|nr:restriction endonuclease subunit S [Lacihabitans sp. CCS-44]MCP9755188.1 restriction endonuclease subunit S [Lacihabitans sp. CCS-44]
MKSSYKPLGQYIQPVVGRNNDLGDLPLVGLSIHKKFIPSIANTVGTDMSTYRIIEKNQFAYGPVTSRNGDKITIALFTDYEKALISQAYIPFEVKDKKELDPEYLMMWFRRPEFDRYARFKSHGSAREIFDWEEMCNTQLPIPHIDKQREIVKEYNVIQNRIALNQQLIQKLEETAQAIYKQWFVEFEFPDVNGNPYKSSGGEMVWCEELGKGIPLGWELKCLKDISEIKTGPFGSALLNEQYISGGTPVITVEHIKDFKISNLDYPSVTKEDSKRLKAYALLEGDIIFSRVGSVDLSALIQPENEGWLFSSRMLRLRPKKDKIHPILLSNFLKLKETRNMIISLSVGSTMPSINTEILAGIPFCYFPNFIGDKISNVFVKFDKLVSIHYLENQKLKELKELLLSRLATVE